jgi:hypothetical protein
VAYLPCVSTREKHRKEREQRRSPPKSDANVPGRAFLLEHIEAYRHLSDSHRSDEQAGRLTRELLIEMTWWQSTAKAMAGPKSRTGSPVPEPRSEGRRARKSDQLE